MTGKAADKVAVLYLGTATYDIEKYKNFDSVTARRFSRLALASSTRSLSSHVITSAKCLLLIEQLIGC